MRKDTKIFRRYDEGWLQIAETTEGAYPDSLSDESLLQRGHIHGPLHLHYADGSEDTYFGHTIERNGR